MRDLRTRWRFQSSWASWLGMLCITLVLLTGVVQVAHAHNDGQISHDNCSLCLTVHNTVQTATPTVLDVSVRPVHAVAPESIFQLPRQRFLLKLAIRPPPAVPVAA